MLDLRAISKAQISTHLECMGISNGNIWFLTMGLLLIYVGFGILSIVENVGY